MYDAVVNTALGAKHDSLLWMVFRNVSITPDRIRVSRHWNRPPGVKGILGKFADDRRGVVIVMFALMLPILVSFIGLGTEVTLWYSSKRNLQTIADAASIAGAYERLQSDYTSSSITSVVTIEATSNGYDSSTDTLTAVNPASSGAYTADTSSVEVNLTRSIALLFSAMFMDSAVSINARAVANSVAGGNEACVLALDGSASKAVSVSGTASVDLDGCEVAANSTASDAIDVSGAADLTVDCASTPGGTDGTITMNECSSANTGISAITDPYSSLTVPAESTDCDTSSNVSSSDGDTYSVANNDTNGDGVVVFCGKLTINAGDSVTFETGTVFVMNGKAFSVSGGANVTGTNITMVFTGSGGTWASASINGGGTIAMSAQTTGDYAGILFYQDGSATDSPSNNFTFNGGSNTEMTGVIYVPENDVSFSGGNETDDNGCLQIVASQVSFSGNADIENDCSGTGVGSIYTSYVVSLVE